MTAHGRVRCERHPCGPRHRQSAQWITIAVSPLLFFLDWQSCCNCVRTGCNAFGRLRVTCSQSSGCAGRRGLRALPCMVKRKLRGQVLTQVGRLVPRAVWLPCLALRKAKGIISPCCRSLLGERLGKVYEIPREGQDLPDEHPLPPTPLIVVLFQPLPSPGHPDRLRIRLCVPITCQQYIKITRCNCYPIHIMWLCILTMFNMNWKRPWCWGRLRAGEEGDHRGRDGWMASSTQWTWVWANSRRWWRTGKPGMLQSMGSQRVRHDWANEQQSESSKEKWRFGVCLDTLSMGSSRGQLCLMNHIPSRTYLLPCILSQVVVCKEAWILAIWNYPINEECWTLLNTKSTL